MTDLFRPPHPDPAGHRDDGRVVAAALAAVAAAGRTGSARPPAGNGAALHFRNGRVVGAELAGSPFCRTLLIASGRLHPVAWSEFADAWGRPGTGPRPMVPSATGLDLLEWAAVSLEAIVEAAFELLAPGSESAAEDLVFQPGDVPGWTGSSNWITVAGLYQEIARRRSVLDRLHGVLTPDSALERASKDRLAPVQVSAQQWRVLSALRPGETVRSLAAGLGYGLFGMMLLVRTLMTLEMVTTRGGRVAGQRPPVAFSVTLFSDAAGDAVGTAAGGSPA